MMASAKPTTQTLDRILDRCYYQAVQMAGNGDIHFDGGLLSTLDRENALELLRQDDALRVYAFNLIEGTCSDITDELAGEIEYERDEAIKNGETYVPRLTLHASSAGRVL